MEQRARMSCSRLIAQSLYSSPRTECSAMRIRYWQHTSDALRCCLLETVHRHYYDNRYEQESYLFAPCLMTRSRFWVVKRLKWLNATLRNSTTRHYNTTPRA